MKKFLKTLFVLLIAVVIVGAIIMVSSKDKEEPPVSIPPVVSAQAPETGTIQLQTELMGIMEPKDEVYVIPKMSGELLTMDVKLGDAVTEGQTICTINSDALDSYKIGVDSASISLNDARKTLERMQVLFNSGDIPLQSLEQAQNGVKVTQLQYDQAKNTYDLNLKYTKVTAPISGIIEALNVDVHDMVSPQVQICVISGKEEMFVSFQVSEKIMKSLTIGTPIQIEKSGSNYNGTVVEISSIVNQQTGLFTIKASVTDASALTTGSTVKLIIPTDKAEDTMLIPVDSVYYDEGNPFTYVYNNGKLVKTSLEIGIYDSNNIAIISGLTYDNLVVTTWSNELFDGAAVTLANTQ